MSRNVLYILLFCLIIFGHSCQNDQKNNIKQFIILKADDLTFNPANTISQGWLRWMYYIENMKIKGSVGIVCNSLEKGDDKYISLIKSIHSRGAIEFWNHGYNHYQSYKGEKKPENPVWEFRNSSYEEQYEHLLKSQELVRTKLGIPMPVFGAPYNYIDKNTLKAVENIDEIKVWFFGDSSSTKFILSGRQYGDIEFPAHNPNFQKFLDRYNSRGKGREYLVLQVHPNGYDDNKFKEFEQCINFLIKQGVTFIKPSEYYQIVMSKNK